MTKPQTVARRALAIKSLIYRAHAESLFETDPATRTKWADITEQVRSWSTAEGIDPMMSPVERSLFASAYGTWPREAMVATMKGLESMAVLLWAIRIIDWLPPHWQRVDNAAITACVPILEPVAGFVDAAMARPEAEVMRMGKDLQFWRWRIWIEGPYRRGEILSDNRTVQESVEHGARYALTDGIVPHLMGNDVPSANGRPFHDLSPVECAVVDQVITARMTAISWVAGPEGGPWDGPPVRF